MSAMRDLEETFKGACAALFDELSGGEELSVGFSGESSDFLRFNRGKVRQIGHVDGASLRFKYYRGGRSLASGFEATGEAEADRRKAAMALEAARREAALLPPDPYQVLPKAAASSREEFPGRLPDPGRLPQEILGPGQALEAAGAEFVGIHAQGPICRGAATSAGARHWFAAESFIADYSAYLPNGKALKSCYAGREWDGGEYARRLASEASRLEALGRPERAVPPGEYRAYIAPEALAEFIDFFSWYGLSERQIREGESAFISLKEGRTSLSPRFDLVQDFSLGVEPRFNESGEVAPERLRLIAGGKLASTLVSARSERQYGLPANAAPEEEFLRSAAIGAGELDEDRALEALGTGLYLSNLHYLNWSDVDSARVTGMTRFACFWVEGGRIVSPIKDLRFDDSLYRVFGDRLEALTARRSLVVNPSTYEERALGGSLLPGILLSGLTFTL
ncbi:MAG TPA: metallopeptidase TldD-related protein [Spirochaetales bacterium]|nr:metallopeptidase TldD-related protein [Spirochaetales bacterium]HRY53621.1 metallopeptidase TldD-related protein [Spirochaetia bacterium]HRZ64625.1 metallopeptidase TldD-related protein [Spirochaetia bacterium]